MKTVFNDGFTKITWNESATFNVFFAMGSGDKTWLEADVFTVYGVESVEQAEREALEHANEINEILD